MKNTTSVEQGTVPKLRTSEGPKGLGDIQRDLKSWDSYIKPSITLVSETEDKFSFKHEMVNEKLYAECVAATPLSVGAQGIRKCWASQGKSDSGELYKCRCGKSHSPQELYENSEYGNAGKCPSCSIIIDKNEIDSKKELVCGEADRSLIDRIGNKFKHGSTLEHIVFSFDLRYFSRALLQELSRHRMASPSVKSTRYTLKELMKEDIFDLYTDYSFYKFVNLFKADNEESNSPTAYLRTPLMRDASRYVVFTGDIMTDVATLEALRNLQFIIQENVKRDKEFKVTIDTLKYALPDAYRTEEFLTINARSLQNLFALRSSKSALWEIRELSYVMYAALPKEYRYLFEDHIYYPGKEKDEEIQLLKSLSKKYSKEEFLETIENLYKEEK